MAQVSSASRDPPPKAYCYLYLIIVVVVVTQQSLAPFPRCGESSFETWSAFLLGRERLALR